MNRFLLVALSVLLVLLLSTAALAQGFRNLSGTPPTPTLLSPPEKVDLSGKDTLKFKWYSSGCMGLSRLEFKVYKGYVNSAANLVYQEDLSGASSSVLVKAELFQQGEVYTYTLRAIATGGQKGDLVSDTFEVVGK